MHLWGWMIRAALAFWVTVVTVVPAAAFDRPLLEIAGVSHDEALRLGEQMYRRGLLPSGEPMTAVVQWDIEVDGSMFSCESCHLRSGVGSIEGQVITLPTNATELYKPFSKAAEEVLPSWQEVPKPIQTKILRPAYTDDTLAAVLWNGIDPSGRELSWTMPRYELSEADMALLVYYLKHLNAEFSPGVTENTLHFAAVIAPGVSAADREAFLAPLQAFIDGHNNQSRRQEERAKRSPFYRKKMLFAWRRIALDLWELQGPPESWRAQLEGFYRERPVFALLGGISDGGWAPVHRFCEENRVPAIFPLTDFPVISDSDWYTLYFSKGWYQEGESAARYLTHLTEDPARMPVVQVLRDTPEGRSLARGFRETRQLLKLPPAAEVGVPQDGAGAEFWQRLLAEHPGATLVAWLPAADLAPLKELKSPPQVVTSARLQGFDFSEIPDDIRANTLLTWPNRLPADYRKPKRVVETWLRVRNIPLGNIEIQTKSYYLGWILSMALMHMGSDYYRDFFLDCFDMLNDEVYAIANYDRLTFGPGQRYGSKGCYLVQLGPGPEPQIIRKSDWLVH